MGAQLIQSQNLSPDCSVSVWKELAPENSNQHPCWQYRKVWASSNPRPNTAWLSWAHHEHLVLTLLAGRGAQHVVQVSGLQVSSSKVELMTLDAGSDFERDWLAPARLAQKETLWVSEDDALKWARACLMALESVHRLGLVHGDLKSDNICITASQSTGSSGKRIDLSSIRLIDFAYSLYRDAPLQFVLPTDPFKLDYLPEFFKSALVKAQSQNNVSPLNAVACANIDLYSLSCLLEKTVSHNTASQWKDWSYFLEMCRREGQSRSENSFFKGQTNFEAPTQKLLKMVESILKKRHVPLGEWVWADTAIVASVDPTPLISSSVHEVVLTPLVQAPHKQVPKPASLYGLAYAWVYAYLMLIATLWVIDSAYSKYGLTLSDAGYYLALLAMPIFSWLSIVIIKGLIKKQPPIWGAWRTSVLLLFSIEIYFGFTLPLSEELFLQIFLSLLMALCLWAVNRKSITQKVV
jgi:serine/threonine protein kinase